ncbi:MAG: flagellar hook protein FlgE [Candidatus Dadabacteria bacterium]|nr:MAG: flagellar hook protein FlgE [Candidatus Dadabacteria bacterium]
MASILNGLFSGRAGISSHGVAISVVSDNISNSSTIAFKTSRAEFSDLIAGSQITGRIIGSGSSVNKITRIEEQGTLEFTNRPLDLAIDGSGYFIVADGATRYYTRAGNFKVNSAGYIVDQNGFSVLGFPSDGTGSLQPINVNNVSQGTVKTSEVTISGNLNASADILTNGSSDIPTVSNAGSTTSTTTYADLSDVAAFSTVVDVFDSLGESHTVTFFFFHTASNTWVVNGYVNSEEVDPTGSATGLPRLIGSATLTFSSDGTRSNTPSSGSQDIEATIPWNNGSTTTDTIDFTFDPFTQFSAPSAIQAITQDGKGIGSVTSISVDASGNIFALLDNGQTSTIATIGMATFANAEGLDRVGNNLLQESTESGEPVIGSPGKGNFGSIQSGSLELSTVDLASEFIKIVTLQRGFQASSRIITTINQLLNEIIQLA